MTWRERRQSGIGMRVHRPGRVGVLALALLWSVGSLHGQEAQFRGAADLVSVQVCVVDKNGEPVRGLTRSNFEIRENGEIQTIAHFTTLSVEDSGEVSGAGRTFLIVLGRGSLNAPTNALQALIDFVRSRTALSDRVGVVAYLKAIEPTTNHGGVISFLSAFRAQHEQIDHKIVRDLSGGIATDTRQEIDSLFRQDDVRVRELAAGGGNVAVRFNDLRYLSTALEYLHTVDGDKHVILVTERPFLNARLADRPSENYWIRQAASSRTTLSFIDAGGLKAPSSIAGRYGRMESPLGFEPGLIKDQAWLATQTGGKSAFFEFADRPLMELERTTRLRYVLGYYPVRPVAPDLYRDVEVAVDQANVTLSYRHGYQAQPSANGPAEYRQLVTKARLADGANKLLEPDSSGVRTSAMGVVPKLPLKVSGNTSKGEGSIQVSITVDPTWVYFRQETNEYVAELDLSLMADDVNRNVVGEHTQPVTLRLTADQFDRTQRRLRPQSLSFEVTMKVRERPEFVRGILYQFDTDRTISGQVRIANNSS